MPRYLVARSWLVEADTAEEAVEKATPGGHQDERALLVFKSAPAVVLKFTTSEIVNLKREEGE